MNRDYSKAPYMRDDKIELCNKAISNLQNIIDALNEIKKGEAESGVCRKYNINKSNLRHFVFNNDKFNMGQDNLAVEFNVDTNALTSGGEKLYLALMGEKAPLPYDINETMEYCLKHTKLKDRQLQVIRMRYWEEMTLEEIGKQFGLSRERVRQIEARALRVLYGNHKKLLTYGCNAYLKMQIEEKENYLIEKQLLVSHLKELETKIETYETEEERLKTVTKLYEVPKEKTIRDLLSENNTSVRLHNVLTRGKINGEWVLDFTLKELQSYSKKEILQIRNLGLNSLLELEELLAKEGIYLAG